MRTLTLLFLIGIGSVTYSQDELNGRTVIPAGKIVLARFDKLVSQFNSNGIVVGLRKAVVNDLSVEISGGYSTIAGTFDCGSYNFTFADFYLSVKHPVVYYSNGFTTLNISAGTRRSVNLSGKYSCDLISTHAHTNMDGYFAGFVLSGVRLFDSISLEVSIQSFVSLTDLALGVSEKISPCGIMSSVGMTLPLL